MKTPMRSRNDFAPLLCDLELTGSAVEVGTAAGYFSHYLLDRWPGTLTQIDPWRILSAPGFSGHGEDTDAGQEARYQQIMKAARKYKGRCRVMRATSEEAAPRFKDGSLDFCYLDAAHNYDSIKQDIALWYPKVKSTGIFAGHDHLEGFHNGQEYGVKRAVTEFATAHGLAVNVIAEEWPSWWIRKLT